MIVPSRFRGPARSGNGGWSAGALAELVAGCPTDHAQPWPTIEVTLRKPPPLDVDFEPGDVGQAVAVDRRLTPVDAVDVRTTRGAASSYPGFVDHPFPGCFTCGTARAEGDGLRIFPGRITGDLVAATWTPHESVAEDFHTYATPEPRASYPVTWAALDCPGGWAYIARGRPAVLGRMTARVDALPRIGVEHVVVGRWLDKQGRKVFTASTLYDDTGQAIATAEHVWIEVDPTAFN